MRFPVLGGFVPFGARRPNGAQHPHAGTGFGICTALRFPADAAGNFSWTAPCDYSIEVRQFAYDGRHFESLAPNAGPTRTLFGVRRGLEVWGNSLTMAIRTRTTCSCPNWDSGLARQLEARQAQGWRLRLLRRHSLAPPAGRLDACVVHSVTDTMNGWIEPSLVRDRMVRCCSRRAGTVKRSRHPHLALCRWGRPPGNRLSTRRKCGTGADIHQPRAGWDAIHRG